MTSASERAHRTQFAAAACMLAMAAPAFGAEADPSATKPKRAPATAGSSVAGENAKDAARGMAREALELMHDERWGDAHSLLDRAYEIVPAPTIAVLDGQALEHLGRLVEAAQRFEVASLTELDDDSPDAYRSAVREAVSELQRLRKRIPRLTIVLNGSPPDAERIRISLNGQSLPFAVFGDAHSVDPGEHVVRASLDGRIAVEDRIVLKEGEAKQIHLSLAGDPPQPPEVATPAAATEPQAAASPHRPWAWTAFGIGGAGLSTGAIAGWIMLNAKSTLDEGCRPNCPQALADELSRFRTSRTVSTVGYIAGGAGVAAGATLLLVGAATSKADTGVAAWTSGRVVGIKGTF